MTKLVDLFEELRPERQLSELGSLHSECGVVGEGDENVPVGIRD
jgi:hypothetical protein